MYCFEILKVSSGRHESMGLWMDGWMVGCRVSWLFGWLTDWAVWYNIATIIIAATDIFICWPEWLTALLCTLGWLLFHHLYLVSGVFPSSTAVVVLHVIWLFLSIATFITPVLRKTVYVEDRLWKPKDTMTCWLARPKKMAVYIALLKVYIPKFSRDHFHFSFKNTFWGRSFF